jgi:hypothetical protein
MADEKGRWFKCYTSLQDSEVWDDLQALRCWLWCMQNVNWKDQKTFGKTFPRGSFWCNVRDAAKACRCSTNSWTAAMRKLVGFGMITMTASPKYTTIKVVNWDRFQGGSNDSSVSKIETRTETHTETVVETRTDTQPETRSRSIRTGSNVDTPAATPPGDSSDKPAKPKTKPPAFDPLAIAIPPALDTPLFRQAWAAWAAHRSEIKARLTEQSTKQQIRLLVELGHDKAVETIRTSIRQSWRGLFPQQPQHKPHERQFKLLNDPIPGVTPDMGVRRKANP